MQIGLTIIFTVVHNWSDLCDKYSFHFLYKHGMGNVLCFHLSFASIWGSSGNEECSVWPFHGNVRRYVQNVQRKSCFLGRANGEGGIVESCTCCHCHCVAVIVVVEDLCLDSYHHKPQHTTGMTWKSILNLASCTTNAGLARWLSVLVHEMHHISSGRRRICEVDSLLTQQHSLSASSQSIVVESKSAKCDLIVGFQKNKLKQCLLFRHKVQLCHLKLWLLFPH